MRDRFLSILGWVATATAMAMFISYISQIYNNLNGQQGSWVQPLVASINCTLWLGYALLKRPKRDWPLAVANFPGVLFGLITFFTAL